MSGIVSLIRFCSAGLLRREKYDLALESPRGVCELAVTGNADGKSGYGFPALARSCLWLWVPPLGASLALWGQLPPAYQPEYFDRWVPPLLGLAETILKLGAIVISTLLVLGWSRSRNRLGLGLYGIGVAIYLASYLVLIRAPDAPWAQSFVGFTAPAFTPAIWITGIGLMISHGVGLPTRWLQLGFWGCAIGFLVTHNINASLVYAAVSAGQ